MEAKINMSQLNYNQLQKKISTDQLDTVYFFEGEDYLIQECEKLLKNKILGDKYSDFDFNVFNEENITLEQLSVSMETFPVTSSKKLIIIHNLPLEQWDNVKIDNFTELLKDVPPFAHIIISEFSGEHNAKNMGKIKKIKNFISKHGSVCELSKKDISIEKELIHWAKTEFNKKLPDKYAKKIVNVCSNHNITSLKNELKKVCEFEKSDVITENSLNLLIKSQNRISIFELPKAITSKNISKSLKILYELLAQGEEPISILSVIASEYIDLYRVKSFENEDISKLLELYNYQGKEFRLKNSSKLSKKMDFNKLNLSLKYLIQADEELKSSKPNAKLILSRLIMQLAIYK